MAFAPVIEVAAADWALGGLDSDPTQMLLSALRLHSRGITAKYQEDWMVVPGFVPVIVWPFAHPTVHCWGTGPSETPRGQQQGSRTACSRLLP